MNSKKIKVVFGLNSFMVGGAERQFVEQVKFFNRNQFEITLITLFQFPGKPDLYAELPSNLPVYRLNFANWRDIKSWIELLHLLLKLKPDIVLSGLFFSNTVFRLLKPFVGFAAIACEHNTYIDKPKVQQCIDRALSFISYRIVAVSKTVAAFTAKQEHISQKKFEVIPNGVDIEKLQRSISELPSKEILKSELGFQSSDYIILTAGRLVPQKNQKLLLDGFALFCKIAPSYKLAIV